MSDKIVHGGMSAALIDHSIAEVSLYNSATGRTQRVAVADLRRFCEDVLRVIARHEKEKRDLERLAKRLYESDSRTGAHSFAIPWADIGEKLQEHYRGFARRFRGTK